MLNDTANDYVQHIIIEAAKLGFLKYDYHQFSLSKCAMLAELPLRVVKNYFYNKIDLAVAVMDDLAGQLEIIADDKAYATDQLTQLILKYVPFKIYQSQSFYLRSMVLAYYPRLEKTALNQNDMTEQGIFPIFH